MLRLLIYELYFLLELFNFFPNLSYSEIYLFINNISIFQYMNNARILSEIYGCLGIMEVLFVKRTIGWDFVEVEDI